jgi:hypothetical protein
VHASRCHAVAANAASCKPGQRRCAFAHQRSSPAAAARRATTASASRSAGH